MVPKVIMGDLATVQVRRRPYYASDFRVGQTQESARGRASCQDIAGSSPSRHLPHTLLLWRRATVRSPDYTLYLVTGHALPVRNGGSRAELFYPLASKETPLLQLASFIQFGTVNPSRAVSGNPGVLDCARHFEIILYDNALLSRVYLHAFQASGDPFFRRVVEETLDYVLREMTCVDAGIDIEQLRPRPQLPSDAYGVAGGFYSTQDADSEGEEGRFFVWTPGEVDALLGSEDGPLFRAYYDVTDAGNASTGSAHGFEHKNILHVDHSVEDVATRLGVTPERLTAWNGLMLAAFAEAARVLGRKDYQEVAERNVDFLLHELRTPKRGGTKWLMS
jgi:hypothetical protein